MVLRICFLFIGICLSQGVKAQQIVRLSEMDLTKSYQEYGTLKVGRSVTNEPAVIQGKEYPEVIGVQSESCIRIALHGQAMAFTALAGVAESSVDYSDSRLAVVPLADGSKMYFRTHGNEKEFVGLEGTRGKVERGTVRFVVKGDGKEVFRSRIVRYGETPCPIEVKLKGIKVIELWVEPTEDGPSGDHALWIAPAIVYEGKQPEVLPSEYTGRGPEMAPDILEKLREKIRQLPMISEPLAKAGFDWLIEPERAKAGVYATADGKGVVLANDLVARVFRVFPNLATVDIVNRMTDESMLRAVSCEGILGIDGKDWKLGGLDGQPERGYLKTEWLDEMRSCPQSFLVEDIGVSAAGSDIRWAKSRWALNKREATGVRLTFTLRGEKEMKDVVVKLHYVVYDHIPVIRKSFEVVNHSAIPLNIDAFRLEQLAFADVESPVGGEPSKFRLPNIHVESDYACGGGFTEMETDMTERWVTDPAYTSQRNYLLQTPCVLEVAPPLGPDYTLLPDSVFQSFCVYEMPFDSDDRERKGLFKRRMYYELAPWSTENPVFMHLTSSDSRVIRTAIDQCDSVGYEMIIISFGSGLNAEDISDENITKYKELVGYARSKGIELGCYSLLSSRWISEEVDVINPQTGERGGMCFGSAPCLCSDWGYDYFEKIKVFFEKTGMRCFEHDGSYPGDVCASVKHTFHKGLKDSQWNQFYKIRGLYRWMCENGIYINVPDFYFLNGSTKTGIGYREANWSLPRDRQIIHARQLNYDGTWDRMASACWSFVPLVEYQGGGKAATLEPLSRHLLEYRMHMVQNYGAGVQACYRGPRLYDTPETKAVVTEVIEWYKKYREILNSDIVHLRRPDARDWDGILHVNPRGKEKGLAMFFNPTEREMKRTISLPLYYTGLTHKARLREGEGRPVKYTLARDYTILLDVVIPAKGYTWYVIE